MADFTIHRQLLADCHYVGKLRLCHVLLHKNAVLPWFILVPETEVSDLLDLADDLRHMAVDEAAALARFIKNTLGYRKINFASIGNVVRQLHLHVVGRSDGDPCWPAPVWGNLGAARQYSSAELNRITDLLGSKCELHAVERRIKSMPS
jgi:diadenosine tetraphosphate (Ap4A) HIT family hydrolase